jgi:hypothetical protein
MFFTVIWPLAAGKDILSLSFWLSMVSGLHPWNAIAYLIGYPAMYCFVLYVIFSNFDRPILCAFKEKFIYLYALSGVKKIPWEKVSSLDIKQIENSPGKMSKSLKYFEVNLRLTEETKLQFQFETFSDTRVYEILDVWRVFQINYRLENEGQRQF